MSFPMPSTTPARSMSGFLGLGQSFDSPAEQFASWLPYSAYLRSEQLFVNRDSLGFMLELMPQSGADERMAEVLVSLYANCPPGTGLQFHLFGSPHIRDQLRRYANLRVEDADQAEKAQHWGRPARNDNLFRRLARQRAGHLLRGAQESLTTGFHYALRDFRLMLSVTLPGNVDDLNRIESARRFIQDQQRWLVDQRLSQADALPITVRQRRNVVRSHIGQIANRQCIPDVAR